jgi:hypothetical protein
MLTSFTKNLNPSCASQPDRMDDWWPQVCIREKVTFPSHSLQIRSSSHECCLSTTDFVSKLIKLTFHEKFVFRNMTYVSDVTKYWWENVF